MSAQSVFFRLLGALTVVSSAGCSGEPLPSLGSLGQHLLAARKANVTAPRFVRPSGDDEAPSGPDATLVLFIHGIFGDTVDTWRGAHGSLIELVLDRPEFKGRFDGFAFGFPSAVVTQGSFKIPEAAKALETEIRFRNLSQRYKQIVIVAHSMGGLVALEALTTFPYLQEKVPLVVTFATPYEGSQAAKLGRELIQNPALESMIPIDDANSFLTSLGNRWKQRVLDAKVKTTVVCAYEKVAVPGIGLIVPETSGTKLCDGIADAVAEDHVGIIKPSNADHQSIKVLTNALRGVQSVGKVDSDLTAGAGPFAPLEYVDADYQERGMKACPKGFALGGMNVAANRVTCRRVLAPTEVSFVTSIVDTGTQRAGMHACPSGMYVRGYHDESNRLLCSQDSRFKRLPQEEFEDGVTQEHGMHVCLSRAKTIAVMTGINAGENRFLCARVYPD